MKLELILNLANLAAGGLIAVGVFIVFGLGWALITAGVYLAYNVIMTTRAVNVRNNPTS